jgi:putative endonuclease
MDYKRLGVFGEKIACEYLVNKGYKILGKNCKNNFGEIDIILKNKGVFADKTIHFVEVKTSLATNNNFFPEDRVGYKKQIKLKQLAAIWLSKNKYKDNIPYQIDIASVIIDDIKKKAKIKIFYNIAND